MNGGKAIKLFLEKAVFPKVDLKRRRSAKTATGYSISGHHATTKYCKKCQIPYYAKSHLRRLDRVDLLFRIQLLQAGLIIHGFACKKVADLL